MDYVTRWSMVIGGGFFLAFLGFVVLFIEKHLEKKEKQK